MAQQDAEAVATEAVLTEIDEQTPENSVHRAYAASVREANAIQEMDIKDIAREEGVAFEPENAEEIAESTINSQRDMFESCQVDNQFRNHLDSREIDYHEDAPELPVPTPDSPDSWVELPHGYLRQVQGYGATVCGWKNQFVAAEVLVYEVSETGKDVITNKDWAISRPWVNEVEFVNSREDAIEQAVEWMKVNPVPVK